MDQYTNLNRFSQPLRPDLAKFIISEHDAYIVRTGVPEMSDIWPGCEVEIIPNAGHIQGMHAIHPSLSNFLPRSKVFCKTWTGSGMELSK